MLYEDLSDNYLVAHSNGGMVISGVAEKIPERLTKLIYLDAFVPFDGESISDLVGPDITAEFERIANMYGEAWRIPHDAPQDSRMTDLLLKPTKPRLLLTNPEAAKL